MALEQHAIPSQVTSYEFRLVGDMTIKQFGWLAGGILLAILAYSFPLPSFIRWSAILTFAPSGAIIAFIPIEGRGLDRWIIAFFKAIYSPTEFIWHQEHPIPEFFKKSSGKNSEAIPTKVTRQDKSKLEKYIHTLPVVRFANTLDQQESLQIQHIDQLLSLSVEPSPSSSFTSIKPTATLRSLGKPSQQSSSHTSIPSSFSSNLQSLTSKQVKEIKISSSVSPKTTPSPSLVQLPPGNQFPISPPLISNIIVGMIIDQQGKIVDGAIIEIKDQYNKPVRALKSNKLGQFAIATPLKNGAYTLQIEKNNLTFDNIRFQVEGKIIPPISIVAK